MRGRAAVRVRGRAGVRVRVRVRVRHVVFRERLSRPLVHEGEDEGRLVQGAALRIHVLFPAAHVDLPEFVRPSEAVPFGVDGVEVPRLGGQLDLQVDGDGRVDGGQAPGSERADVLVVQDLLRLVVPG